MPCWLSSRLGGRDGEASFVLDWRYLGSANGDLLPGGGAAASIVESCACSGAGGASLEWRLMYFVSAKGDGLSSDSADCGDGVSTGGTTDARSTADVGGVAATSARYAAVAAA